MNTTNWLWLIKCFKVSGEGIKDQTVNCENGSFSGITKNKQKKNKQEGYRRVKGC